jgi:hypothetical protein
MSLGAQSGNEGIVAEAVSTVHRASARGELKQIHAEF